MLNHNYTASLIGMEDAIVTNLKKDSRTRISREENRRADTLRENQRLFFMLYPNI